MFKRYSTGFTGCTIEEVPNFDRWFLFKYYQDSNYYNVVLGKNNVDNFLKEFKQIHGIKEDEPVTASYNYRFIEFICISLKQLKTKKEDDQTKKFAIYILQYLQGIYSAETKCNKLIVNQDVRDALVKTNHVAKTLNDGLNKECRITRFSDQLYDYLSWIVGFDAKYVYCNNEYKNIVEEEYYYYEELNVYLNELLDKDDEYYEEPEDKFNLSNIDLRTIVCYEHWLLYQISLDDTYLKKLIGEVNYSRFEAKHSYAKGLFDLCECIITDLKALAKYSTNSGTKIFSEKMLEHIQFEFRKWKSDNTPYKSDDKLYLSIDRYLEEKEDLKLPYKNGYSYNIHEMFTMLVYFECKHIYNTRDYRMVLRWVESDYWKSLLKYKIKESDDEPKIVEKIVEVIIEKKIEKSYNFNLLKQSLDNTCCAICTKSIVDGKIYILDCGHICHETCLNPDIKCQLCDLNEWDIVNQ